jgi:3-deoxy-D-arabino-heptulosonate 7-phosphate (DAHP) synthase class II
MKHQMNDPQNMNKMSRYTITFVKENGFKNHYQTVVEAVDEKEAFLKARDEAESKGIELPKEVWTRTHKHKGT